MEDRLVQYPNRVRLVQVDGQPGVYDIEAVPGTVTANGTPLNKATLLSDAVATLVNNAATPNEALKYLAERVQPIKLGGTGATTAAEARKAILENKALSIAQGGTGKTTAAEALKALGGLSWTKVWENASPTSQFNAQLVAVNLQGFDLIIIIGKYSGGSYNSFVGIYKTIAGTKGFISIAVSSIAKRELTVKSGGVQFNNGVILSTYGGSETTNNTVAIPTEIYGVKGVI